MKKQVKPKKISWPFKTVSPGLDKQHKFTDPRAVADSMMEALGYKQMNPPFEGEPEGFNKDIENPPGKATRYDEGKTDWSLMPFDAVEEINKVLEFGAKKYAPNNWKKGFPVSRVLNSCLRHLFSFLRGERVDPESGLSHIAHAACNLLFILYFLKYKEKYADFIEDQKNT